jgi:hypothetical protein
MAAHDREWLQQLPQDELIDSASAASLARPPRTPRISGVRGSSLSLQRRTPESARLWRPPAERRPL